MVSDLGLTWLVSSSESLARLVAVGLRGDAEKGEYVGGHRAEA